MKILIHLGMHKTGSSLLQQRIFSKIKGAYYIPREDSRELKRYIQYADDFEFNPEEGRRLFSKIKNVSTYSKIIISDEELYGNPYWSNIDRKRNIDRILSIFEEEAHFLLFIRNQNTILNSLYNQYIKTGGTAKFSSFLDHKKPPHYVSKGYFNYSKYINHIKISAGEKKLKLILFEEFLEHKTSVIEDIASFIGCESPQLEKEDLKITNPSLNNKYLPCLRTVNKLSKSPKNPFNLFPYTFQLAFRKMFLRMSTFSKTEKKFQFKEGPTLEEIKRSNNDLIEQLRLPLKAYNYPI